MDTTVAPSVAPSRLAAARDVLRERRPGVARFLAALWRRPTAVLLPFALVTTGLALYGLQPFDMLWFVDGGRTITSRDAWHVFSDAGLQMGPLYLALVGGVVRGAETIGLPVMSALGAVLALLVVWSADAVTRTWAALTGAPALAARWAVGGALVGGGMLAQVSTSGHQEEVLLALVLAATAAAVSRGRGARAGLLLAIGAGIKLWAVLGGPLVLHGRRPRTVVVGTVTALAGAAAMYLPFFLWGEVRTFDFSWGIAGGSSPLGMLGALVGLDDWGLRCVQALAAGVAGTLVAVRRHGSALAVAITVIAVRLLLEPIASVYYGAPLALLGVLWCWTSPVRPGPAGRVAAVLAVPLTVLHPYLVGDTVRYAVDVAVSLGVLCLVLLRERAAGTDGYASAAVGGTRAPE